MSVPLFAPIACLAIGAMHVWAIIDALSLGAFEFRGRILRKPIVLVPRSERPLMFWTWIAGFGIIAVAFLAIAAYTFWLKATA